MFYTSDSLWILLMLREEHLEQCRGKSGQDTTGQWQQNPGLCKVL